MKLIFDSFLFDIKRVNFDVVDLYFCEIKKLKFEEFCWFKKKVNEDQYRFNLKLMDVLDEVKFLCFI